tara:strand:+ start:648 stop:1790 length:1143 start_codon:yes stop_codon:yes gene_type:complete
VRILHIINGLSNGGTEGVLYRLILEDQLNEHCVLSLTDFGIYGQKLLDKGIKVEKFEFKKNLKTLKQLFLLYRFSKKINPDIIQTWMYHSDLVGGIVGKLIGTNAIFWGIRNSNLDKDKVPFSTRIIVKINAILSNLIPTKIISCSVLAKNIHQKLGYSKAKTVVIPNGFDLNKFKPKNESKLKLRSELKIDENTCLLGMIARWHHHKDHNNLFRALNLLNQISTTNWKILLVGHLIDESNIDLMSNVKKYKLENHVIILKERDDIETVYNAIDINILSSFGEAFPNVIAEAMGSGIPCISSDVGDASLIIGKTGWLVEPNNYRLLMEILSKSITEFINDKSSWSIRKVDCRERIQRKYSIERMVDSYINLWNNHLKETE